MLLVGGIRRCRIVGRRSKAKRYLRRYLYLRFATSCIRIHMIYLRSEYLACLSFISVSLGHISNVHYFQIMRVIFPGLHISTFNLGDISLSSLKTEFACLMTLANSNLEERGIHSISHNHLVLAVLLLGFLVVDLLRHLLLLWWYPTVA